MIVFRPPRAADIAHVGANMRAIDALECRVFGGHDNPTEALQESVDSSDWSVAAEIGAETVGVFGLASSEGLLSGKAAPWLLGVTGLESHARWLLTYSGVYLDRMRAEYDVLENWVLASNRASIRFLRWCGFVMDAPTIIDGEQAVRFSWARETQQQRAA